jgi:hypothetical protein
MSCPDGHGLKRFRVEESYFCSLCKSTFDRGTYMYSCFACDYDACSGCFGLETRADPGVFTSRNKFQLELGRQSIIMGALSDPKDLQLLWERIFTPMPKPEDFSRWEDVSYFHNRYIVLGSIILVLHSYRLVFLVYTLGGIIC